MADHDDRDLEEAFRSSLQRHADRVDVSAPVAQRAVAARRRRRQGVVVAAVAAVAVAAVSVAGVVMGADTSQEQRDARAADRSSEPGDVVTEWRTEYWHGFQVDVPADWGWGTAPMTHFDGGPYMCGGPGAMVRADGRRNVNPRDAEAWVGRPIMLSDACWGGGPLENPEAPYVWLGADIPVGAVELGDDFVQETVPIGDSTLTVGARDEDLRVAIMESARSTEGPCPSGYADAPRAGVEPDAGVEADALVVCAYARSGRGYALRYGNVVDAPAGSAFMEAASKSRTFAYRCASEEEEFVVLRISGLRFVVTFACTGIHQPKSTLLLELSEANVAPWAVGGIPATVGGPRGLPARWIYDYFIGGLG